jgi:phage tail sheath gpL-like
MPDTAIAFNQIPSTLRLPGAFIEVDASKAGRAFDPGRILLIGQMLAAGSATPGMPVVVASKNDANTFFGVGSQLAAAFAAARGADTTGLIVCLPLSDAAGAVAASATLTVTAPPTAPGSIPLYIADYKVPIAVAGTETITQTAAAIAAAVNASPNLPVTATAAVGVVTLTARNKGTLGNDIQLQFAMLGTAGGEILPTGFAATLLAALAGGLTDPALATALANLNDTTFDYIASPYTDTGNMGALGGLMNVPGGRWDYNRMIWGHVFTAQRASFSAAVTYGAARNDPHITYLPFYQSPTPVWEVLAAAVAAAAVVLRNDPARPVQGILIPGMVAPPLGSAGQFTMVERQALLWSGCSTFTIDNYGNCYIERLIATYQYNIQSVPDDAWLAVEKTFTLMSVQRQLQSMLLANFPRYKLAADGTRIAPGSAVVTPSIMRAYVVACLRDFEQQGLLNNVDGWVSEVKCAINANNPDRIDILFPPRLIGQLRIMAVLSQFHIYNN